MYVLTLMCILLIVFQQKSVVEASKNLSLDDKNQLQKTDDHEIVQVKQNNHVV